MADDLRGPVDPDAGAAGASPFRPVRRRALPRIHLRIVAAIAVGGFVGGLLRYAVSLALPTGAGGLPWAVFAVNTAGAFVLGLLLILVLEVFPPTTYVRPLLGTGFCGALTTFSSVATGVDQLIARGSAPLAVGYLLGSVLAGLAAAWVGIVLGRWIAAVRQRRG
jgi:CrcB protein